MPRKKLTRGSAALAAASMSGRHAIEFTASSADIATHEVLAAAENARAKFSSTALGRAADEQEAEQAQIDKDVTERIARHAMLSVSEAVADLSVLRERLARKRVTVEEFQEGAWRVAKSAQAQVDALTKECTSMASALAKRETQAAKAKADAAALSASLAEFRTRAAQLNRTLHQTEIERAALQAEAAGLRSALTDVQSQLDASERSCNGWRQQARQIENDAAEKLLAAELIAQRAEVHAELGVGVSRRVALHAERRAERMQAAMAAAVAEARRSGEAAASAAAEEALASEQAKLTAEMEQLKLEAVAEQARVRRQLKESSDRRVAESRERADEQIRRVRLSIDGLVDEARRKAATAVLSIRERLAQSQLEARATAKELEDSKAMQRYYETALGRWEQRAQSSAY